MLFKKLLFVLLLHFTTISANNIKYKMVDLGLFYTDSSEAIAINEQDQVLGFCYSGNNRFLFLWDQNNGVNFIDIPTDCFIDSAKLNNKGQITGTYRSNNNTQALFFWDQALGLWEIDNVENLGKSELNIYEFNDKGQILCYKTNQFVFYDRGKMTELDKLLSDQLKLKNIYISNVNLNNNGYLISNAYNDQNNKYVSYEFENGVFKELPETYSYTTCIDDNKNILFSNGLFFYNSKTNNVIPCSQCDSIKNGKPIRKDSTPCELKKNIKGKLYYSTGVQIKKLIEENSFYYDIPNTCWIADKNSKGFAVGSADTIFSGRHAFLAIPYIEK